MRHAGLVLIGLLVLLCVGTMFLLDATLGLVFLVFCMAVLFWVFAVLKKKLDAEILAAADGIGLQFEPHPLRYGCMEGDYRGHRARISYEGGSAFGGGSALALSTGKPGLAALDIRNVTVVRLEYGLQSGQPADLRDREIEVGKSELRIRIDGVCTRPGELTRALDKLVAAVESVRA